MAEGRDLSSFVRQLDDGRATMELAVEGVHCGGCIRRIENGLKDLDGLVDARVNFTNRRLTAVWRPDQLSPNAIVEKVGKIGFPAQPFEPRASEETERRESKRLLTALAVSGFAAMNIMLLSVSVWAGNVSDISPETRDFFHWMSAAIALPAAAFAGQTFFRSALGALRTRHVNMDVPISLGIILALGLSLYETWHHSPHAYFDSSIMLIFFLLCGRYFDHAMRQRTRAVAGNLAALKVEFAHRLMPDGQIVQVPAGMLRPGDRVIVRPGERVPADGVIVNGASQIDESLVTGETLPRNVVAGATIYAGTANFSGALELEVTAAGTGTLIDEIERLLDKAVAAKSRYVRLADRAAALYAPLVHTAAAGTLMGWLLTGHTIHDSIVTAISVLIITCPCALALAVPAVQVVAAGAMFRNSIFLNAGDAIERMAEADTIVFDKTGTLTLPEPHIINVGDVPPALLARAAQLALSSNHPLATVVARQVKESRPLPNAEEIAGEGVRAMLDGVELRLGSPAFCGMTGEPSMEGAVSRIAVAVGDARAVLNVRQVLRQDAIAVVARLKEHGFATMIVSGDRAEAVAPIAAALGVDEWHAAVKPAGKVALLEDLKAKGRRVLMIGDGLNDSPALAAAHVSLAPIGASDLARSHADAVFLGEFLKPVESAILIARRARTLMRQNLALAAIYNAIAVPIAMAGLVTPLIAAVAMSGSSIAVTLNALRLHLHLRRGEASPVQAPLGAQAGSPAWTS